MVRGKIFVDADKFTVLIPIYGVMVPFHVSNIKSANKTDDSIRINFITPEAGAVGPLKKPQQSTHTQNIHIKELCYKCPDAKNLNDTLRMIKELRKRLTDLETERLSTVGIVEQDKLVVSKAKNPKLTNVFVRPAPTGGRRTTGFLEAHTNGFRFTPSKGDTIGNIKVFYSLFDRYFIF
jgi:nucleosome binding factor SPN SPT16 subunit